MLINSKVDLNLYVSNLTKEDCVNIPKDNFKDIKQIWGKYCVYQWDNDLKHKSKPTIDFYEKNMIDKHEWPPYSLNLNPSHNI